MVDRYTAHVMYEMAKLTKSPAGLTPSFTQWERYSETCAGLFSTTVFGQKVAQLSRLCGLTSNAEVRTKINAASAEEMAKALCAIGTLKQGYCEDIEIVGGPPRRWVAVFCEPILSFRVEVFLFDRSLVSASQVTDNYHTLILT